MLSGRSKTLAVTPGDVGRERLSCGSGSSDRPFWRASRFQQLQVPNECSSSRVHADGALLSPTIGWSPFPCGNLQLNSHWRRRNAYRTLTHLQPVPFCVRRATAADVERLLALQDDCCMRIQVSTLRTVIHPVSFACL